MASRYWVNDDADNDWFVANNWSASSGGAGGAGIPTSSDDVIFDGSVVDDCNVDGDIDILSLTVTSGYSGRLDFLGNTTTSRNVANDVTLDGTGTVDWGSTSISTWTIGGNLDYTDQTSTTGNTTLELTGTSKILAGGNSGSQFVLMTVSGSYTSSVNIYCRRMSVSLGGTLNIAAGSVFCGTSAASIAGDLVISSGAQYRCDTQTEVTIESTGTVTGDGAFDMHEQNGELIIDGSATFSPGSFSLRRAGTISSQNGTATFDAPATFDCNNGTRSLTFNGDIIFTGDVLFFANAAEVYTVDNSSNPNLTFQGDVTCDWTASSSWSKGTGTITFSGTADQNINFGGESTEDFVFDKSAGTLTFTGDFSTESFTVEATDAGTIDLGDSFSHSIAGDVTLDGTGAFDWGASTITIGGNLDYVDQTSQSGGQSLVLTGTSKTISAPSSTPNFNWTIQGTITLDSTNGITTGFSKTVVEAGASLTLNSDWVFGNNSSNNIAGTVSVGSGVTASYSGGGPSTIESTGVITGLGSLTASDGSGSPVEIDIHPSATIDVPLFQISKGARIGVVGGTGTIDFTDTAVVFNGTTGTRTLTIEGDCLFNDVTFQSTGSGTYTINNSLNNPNFEIQGDLTVNVTSGSLTWTKGTGTITFSGSNAQNINFNDESIEDIVINKSSNTVTLAGGFTTDSFTGTDGNFDPAGQTIVITNNCNWASAFTIDTASDALNGSTWTIGGNFTCDGQTLNATAEWNLDVIGTATVNGVGAVAYSTAGGTEIIAYGWTDNGNNTNWVFAAPVEESVELKGFIKVLTGLSSFAIREEEGSLIVEATIPDRFRRKVPKQ